MTPASVLLPGLAGRTPPPPGLAPAPPCPALPAPAPLAPLTSRLQKPPPTAPTTTPGPSPCPLALPLLSPRPSPPPAHLPRAGHVCVARCPWKASGRAGHLSVVWVASLRGSTWMARLLGDGHPCNSGQGLRSCGRGRGGRRRGWARPPVCSLLDGCSPAGKASPHSPDTAQGPQPGTPGIGQMVGLLFLFIARH